ncbi:MULTISPECIES: hypothetical protein [unclassified Sphingomonas]|uniref:hypothetical protein n=1 Tax=unclassified Sphingomonas TaxID=196159 RepID=UPI002ED87172
MTPFEVKLLRVLGSIDASLRQLAGRELETIPEEASTSGPDHSSGDTPRHPIDELDKE